MLNRREWLKRLGVGAAAPLLAAPRKKVSVGAHIWIYSAHQKGFDATPVLEQIFQELSIAGIDGVELMHHVLLHDDQAVARVRALADRYKLPVIGSSWEAAMWDRAQHDRILEQARTVIARLAELKGRTLGISVGDAHHRKTSDELDAQAAILRSVMSRCKDHGITPNLHNHTYEVADGEWDLKGSLARVPEIKLGPDLDWLHQAGVDPQDFIRRYRGRIVFAHLRNRKADGTWPEDITEGVIDYAAIGRLLHQIEFSGNLMIELAHEWKFQPTRSYGESVRISREYVRRIMGY